MERAKDKNISNIVSKASGIFLLLAIIGSLAVVGLHAARAQPNTRASAPTRRTFHAKGTISNLVLNSQNSSDGVAAIKLGPQLWLKASDIVAGNWSLDVIDGKVRNFSLNLTIVNSAGKSQLTLGGLTNVTAGTKSDNGNLNQVFLDRNNSTAFQGTLTSMGGKLLGQSLKTEFFLTNQYVIKILLQNSSNSSSDSSSKLPLYGTTTSITDSVGKNLLTGTFYAITC